MVGNVIQGKHAFAYIRTSMKTSRRASDNQYCAIRDFCKEHDVKLDSVYSVAGTPAYASEFLDQIIAEMQKNSCDTLIVASVSRLGRNPEQVKKDLDKLTNHGIHVCSAQDDMIVSLDIVPEADVDEGEDQDDGFSMSM